MGVASWGLHHGGCIMGVASWGRQSTGCTRRQSTGCTRQSVLYGGLGINHLMETMETGDAVDAQTPHALTGSEHVEIFLH
jgi:hypothetical protein